MSFWTKKYKDMKETRPQLIVLTPVFNEAWILPAFLRATSLWADYIIIADQMSTDGTRELYARYKELKSEGLKELKNDCKLIAVDNPRKEMHMAATRRLLFDEAKKIKGDKILFTLDADEFLTGDFPHTEGWKTILNSEPGDTFCFKWMNIDYSLTKYYEGPFYFWALHVEDETLNGIFPDNFIHEWRIPWPENVKQIYNIEDISFLHFARVNTLRQRNKARFYQLSQTAPMEKYSGVRFHRAYNMQSETVMHKLPSSVYSCYLEHGLNIIQSLQLNDEGEHYTKVSLQRIQDKGIDYFHKLDVWDEHFLQKLGLKDPRNVIDKIIHAYLRVTQKYSDTILVRGIDWVIKKIY